MNCRKVRKPYISLRLAIIMTVFAIIPFFISPQSECATADGWFNIESAKSNSVDPDKLAIVDFNDDGLVNIMDIVYIAKYYGKGPEGDADRDGVTDQRDIDICRSFFGCRSDTYAPETAMALPDNIDNGWTNKAPIKISLTATDKGSGIHEIYYLLAAGSEAGPDSLPNTEYSQDIEIKEDGKYILLYHSTDNAGNQEDVKSLEFGIDTKEPVIIYRIIDVTENSIRMIVDKLEDDNPDPDTYMIAVKKEDDSAQVFSDNWEVGKEIVITGLLPETSYIVEISCGDIAKNSSAESEIVTTLKSSDTTPPVVTTDLAEGWYNALPIRITLDAKDPGDSASGIKETYYVISSDPNADPTQLYTKPVDYVGSEGDKFLRFFSVDNAGNKSETKTVKLSIDTIPPDIAHTVSKLTETSVTLDIVISDDHLDPEKSLLYFGNKDPVKVGSGSVTIDGLAQGTSYDYIIVAGDRAGNKTEIPSAVKTVENPVDLYTLYVQGAGVKDSSAFYNHLVDTEGYIGTSLLQPPSVDEIQKAADQIKAMTDSNDVVIYAIHFDNEEDNPGNYLLAWDSNGNEIGTTQEQAKQMFNVFAGDDCAYLLIVPETCYSKDILNKVAERIQDYSGKVVMFGPTFIDEIDRRSFLLGMEAHHKNNPEDSLLDRFNTIYPKYSTLPGPQSQTPIIEGYINSSLVFRSTKSGSIEYFNEGGQQLINSPLIPTKKNPF